MPWDRDPPNTDSSVFPLRDFPIEKLSRGIDKNTNELTISGTFTVEGDAADADLLSNMTAMYSSSGTLEGGRAWRTSISFVRAAPGTIGDLEMNWMNEDFFSSHPSLDRQGTAGYMDYGSRSMWLNQTLFDKQMLTASNLVASRRIDEFNAYLRAYTPGHEVFHGFGFGHARNSTGSISSYARRPRMTNSDFRDLWQLLQENGR
jgi:hypothetical protein